MTLIGLILGICIILFALYLVRSFMPVPWQTPVLVVIVLLSLLWLVAQFFPGLASVRVR